MLLYYILVEGPCPVVHRSRSMTHSCWMLCIGQSVSSLFTNLCLFLYPCRGPIFIILQAKKYVVFVGAFLLNVFYSQSFVFLFSCRGPMSSSPQAKEYVNAFLLDAVCSKSSLFTNLCILISLYSTHVQ